MVALLLVAVSVGLDNFAASTALGVSGVDRRLRVRIALVFGLFEGTMPLIGLAIGRSLAHGLGSIATPVAGGLLALAGAYAVVNELIVDRTETKKPELNVGRLSLEAPTNSLIG